MTNEQQASFNALVGAFQILAQAHIQIIQGPQPAPQPKGKQNDSDVSKSTGNDNTGGVRVAE